MPLPSDAMTDTSPRPRWWLASDGQWYPPHLHPDASGGVSQPAADPAAETAALVMPDTIDLTGALPRSDGATDGDRPLQPGAYPADPVQQPLAVTLPPYIPPREPIDWEAVKAARIARRKREEAKRKMRGVGAAVAALASLGGIVALARHEADDSGDASIASQPKVTTTEPETTAVPSTTAAPTASPVATAAPTTLPLAGPLSVFDLKPGMCINNDDLTSGLVTTVEQVPCTEPHSHETYFNATYNPADPAYNAEQITAYANQACSDGFTQYVGVPYDRSQYYFLHLAPSADSWTKNNDRVIVCLLFSQNGKLTESVKGKAD